MERNVITVGYNCGFRFPWPFPGCKIVISGTKLTSKIEFLLFFSGFFSSADTFLVILLKAFLGFDKFVPAFALHVSNCQTVSLTFYFNNCLTEKLSI